MTKQRLERSEIQKAPTGIPGLDDITNGGLPQGRPTLVSGGPGSGKTLLGVSFLVNGAQQFAEPGVLMTFEENAQELAQDVRSLGYDLDTLVAQKKLIVDYIHVDRSEIEETGEYDLEGLFVRLEHAIKQIGAKRVMLDTIETLFGGLKDTGILRAELRRLFRWLRDREITAVVTAERGEQMFTRQGLEEYITDAVISLDHRVHEQISTRRIRVVKYRGSTHGTNEYPFLINRDGITVLPVTSLLLEHEAPNERVSTGLARARRHAGRQGLLPRQHRTDVGHGRHRQDHAGGAVRRCRLRARREVPVLPVRGIAAADDPQHARPPASTCSAGMTRDCCSFTPTGRTAMGSKPTCSKCITPSRCSIPTSWCIDPITNLMAVGTQTDVRAMLTRVIDYPENPRRHRAVHQPRHFREQPRRPPRR